MYMMTNYDRPNSLQPESLLAVYKKIPKSYTPMTHWFGAKYERKIMTSYPVQEKYIGNMDIGMCICLQRKMRKISTAHIKACMRAPHHGMRSSRVFWIVFNRMHLVEILLRTPRHCNVCNVSRYGRGHFENLSTWTYANSDNHASKSVFSPFNRLCRHIFLLHFLGNYGPEFFMYFKGRILLYSVWAILIGHPVYKYKL